LESTDEEKIMHKGGKVESTVKKILVNANWSDQGWGNKKSQLFLRLYRGD